MNSYRVDKEATLFEYENGVMYFPEGIGSWCARNGIEIVEINEGGEVWCLRTGHSKWEEYPFESVGTIKSIK